MDIEDDYLSQGGSYNGAFSERAFTSKYLIDSEDSGHYRVLAHSNKICLIGLAPSHPIIKDDLVVTSINFQANKNCNRLDNKVSGKSKLGAQFLSYTSILCSIQCEGRPEPFVVRSNMVAKLIEINEDVVKQPDLLKDQQKGYIAIVLPKLNDYEKQIARWIDEEAYQQKLKAGGDPNC